MSKAKILLFLGILIMALPNLGFSNLVEKIIFLVLGLILILLAYGLYFEKQKTKKVQNSTNPGTNTLNDHGVTIKEREDVTGFKYVTPPSQKPSGGQIKTP